MIVKLAYSIIWRSICFPTPTPHPPVVYTKPSLSLNSASVKIFVDLQIVRRAYAEQQHGNKSVKKHILWAGHWLTEAEVHSSPLALSTVKEELKREMISSRELTLKSANVL